MAEALRIGVIGLGVGAQHVAGYRKIPGCEIVAVCDIDAEKREVARKAWPGVRVLERDTELLDAPDIDVVSIASYDDIHYDQILRGLTAGKHLFVEKPLCRTDTELATIHDALAGHPGLCISSNLVLREAPRFKRLRELVERGAFGQLFHLKADYNYGRVHKMTEGWRGRIEDYSVTLGGAVHVVDLILWLTGERPVEAFAYGSRRATEDTNLTFDDLIVALLKFDSGLVAEVGANFACVYPHFHKFEIYGTRASFENGLDFGRLWLSRDPDQPPQELREAYPGVEKGALLASFIDEIRGRGTAIVSRRDVFDTMSVCLAVDASARAGAPVAIRYHA